MDNDSKIIKKCKSMVKIWYCHALYRFYKRLVPMRDCNDLIINALSNNEPYFVSRLGATEGVIIKKWLNNKKISSDDLDRVKNLSGVFPKTQDGVEKFCLEYSYAIKDVDLLGVFYSPGEGALIKKYGNKNLQLATLKGIEPFYHGTPWSKYLAGKKVLVIHPFAETIMKQYKFREKLFKNDLLPEFQNLQTLKAVQSVAGENAEFGTWVDALNFMKVQIDSFDYDVALIGAGAYGLPLGNHIKNKGKMAIHLGGSLQIMFGIKGKRWDDHPVISKLYNEHWVRPDISESPKNKDVVEGGSYW
jgi:hypothetical protein